MHLSQIYDAFYQNLLRYSHINRYLHIENTHYSPDDEKQHNLDYSQD